MQLTLDGLFGRTSQESCPTRPMHSAISSLVSLARMHPLCRQGNDGETLVLSLGKDDVLHGECSTLNISESPNDVRESGLWQVLERDVPQKYYLSRAAKDGILRRAERRGKALPVELERALRQGA